MVTLGLIFALNSPILAFSPSQTEIRGVWLTTNDTDTLLDQPKLKEAIAQLSRLNFNTLYPVVWNSGYVLYPSAVAKREGIQPFVQKGQQGQDPLQDLIAQAHQKGLLVLPWFEFGFMAPPSSELALSHPQWLSQRRDGSQTTIGAAGEVVWFNPFRPDVQEFLLSLVREVMDLYDVDGIQFDDHLSFPRELGYDQYTINLYKQETQKDVPADFQDEEWMRWRADKITDFVIRLRQTIKAKKSNAILSISPNPYDNAYRFFLQDWLDWVRKDLVDELVVQVYRDNLQNFVRQLTTPEIQEARRKIPTGIGILSGLKTRPVNITFLQEKVIEARKHGFGVSFFFYKSLWDLSPEPPEQRQAQLLALFSQPAKRQLSTLVIPVKPPDPLPTVPEIEDTLASDGIPIPVIIDY